MILLTKHLVIYLFAVISSYVVQTETFDIKVTIQNLDSNEGKVMVGLYDSPETWLSEGIMGEVVGVENNSCVVTFKNVAKGIYAISYIHDENANGEMDTNFMGVPKEDYGCSNNAKGFMGPPKWEDAKFEVTESIELTIN